MRWLRMVAFAVVFVPMLLLPGGCGSGKPRVHGSVTLDGVAVEKGHVTFAPVDGSTPTSGGPIEKGNYAFDSFVGRMRVEITVPKAAGEKELYPGQPNSPKMPLTVESAPAKYNTATTLTYEVKPGDNPKNWELTTK